MHLLIMAALTFISIVLSHGKELSSSTATIKPLNKGLRGGQKPNPNTSEKIGFVLLEGFYDDGPNVKSIQAQFFHDEERIIFVRFDEMIGSDDYYWYGEEVNAHSNTINLLFTHEIEGTKIVG